MSFALSKPRKAQHSGPLHRVSVVAWQLNVNLSKHETLHQQQMATGGGQDKLYSARYAALSLQVHAV